MQYQLTLGDKFEFEGPGLHTGEHARVTVLPAAEDTGLRFELPGGVCFPATAEYVVDTRRATVLGTREARVSTVEHLLAALFAMEVDNALVRVEGTEIPIADGSAKAFADAIAEVGVVTQLKPRLRFIPTAPVAFRDGERLLVVLPAAKLRIRFTADFPLPVGTHFFDAEITPQTFLREIAGSRTFGYLHEVEALRRHGLARGGTFENAIVFGAEGPLQPLRWPNEVVRHKVLDLVGDIALIGARPQCELIAVKSGHGLHRTATLELRRMLAGGARTAQAR